jgi:hypothetical protein
MPSFVFIISSKLKKPSKYSENPFNYASLHESFIATHGENIVVRTLVVQLVSSFFSSTCWCFTG